MANAISGSSPFLGTGENPVHLIHGFATQYPSGAGFSTTYTLNPGEFADSIQITNGSASDYIRATLQYVAGPTMQGNDAILIHPGQSKALTFSADNPITGVEIQVVTVAAGGVDTFVPAPAVFGGVVSVDFVEQ
jgi:hypothetical protein